MPDEASKDFFRSCMVKLNRALIIRRFFETEATGVKNISDLVLKYLIHVPLRHGVRSLKQILSTSELGRSKVFHPHNLPPQEVLRLHVKDYKEAKGDPLGPFFAERGGCQMMDEE